MLDEFQGALESAALQSPQSVGRAHPSRGSFHPANRVKSREHRADIASRPPSFPHARLGGNSGPAPRRRPRRRYRGFDRQAAGGNRGSSAAGVIITGCAADVRATGGGAGSSAGAIGRVDAFASTALAT
jgi:hypothetical protein